MSFLSNKIKLFRNIGIILLLISYMFLFKVNADTTTVTYVGTASDIGGGSFSWSNTNNVIGNTTSTSASSTISSYNGYTNYLSLTNFDLSGAGLPINAQINGIQVEVERDVSNKKIRDTTIQLTKNGTTGIGDNYGNDSDGSTSKNITTYGGLNDLWGTTWSASDLFSSNFGIILQYRYRRFGSANVNIYRVRITVDYTPLTETLFGNLLDFETNGGYNITEGTWTRTITNPYEGAYSMESGNKINYSTSCFEIGKNLTKDGTISFFKEVSSEANYDFLRFYINGIQNGEWAGEINWSQEMYNITAGFNTFKWCYEKDQSVSNGQDTAWVDYIEIKENSTPGGVSSGLQFWLKADKGTSTTTDGASLNTWYDQSGNGFDAIAGTAPIYYSTTNHLNFNPIIDFNGSSQYLQNLNNGGFSQSYYMVIVPDNTVDGKLEGQVPFGFDCDSGNLSSGTCGLNFAGLTLGAFTVAINDEVLTHAIGSSTNWRSAQIGATSYEVNKPMIIGINENAGVNGNDIFEKGLDVDNYSINNYQTLSSADFNIGRSTDSSYRSYYDGKIAEIIDFSSRLSNFDRQKIESYLALKYGVTLNSGNNNYIASDGTTNFWSTSVAGTYKNNIFGIGRDDGTGLSQIKSKSVSNDNILIVEAIGEGSNLSPNFSDMGDLEFLTISHDNGGNNWIASGSPSGYNILSRSWKTQETGDVGSLNLDFDVGNSNFDVPNPNLGSNYYFVYDSNNNNSFSDETPQLMINTSGNTWQISGINLSNLNKFTIATQASTNNIPTDITISNNSIAENSPSGSNIGNFSTTDLDSGDIHTYSLVSGEGDSDNSFFTILGNTLSINEFPDYELKSIYNIRVQTDDGNGGQYQKQFNIYINNVGEAINSIIDFEIASSKYTVTSGIWTRTTSNSNEGSYSHESDNVGASNSQSCFEVTNTFIGTGTITFDYNVSSQSGSDYLRFYIDNVDTQNWSGTVPWTTYTNNTIDAGTHTYKWCYIKDGSGSSGSDQAWIDYITFTDGATDITNPVIFGVNYSSGSILPGGNHNIIINYIDNDSGINTGTDSINLYKWNGTSWGSDIASSGFNLGTKTITPTSATYATNNLDFGKYSFNFSISDNAGNLASFSSIFYIDKPEINVSTGVVDLGDLSSGTLDFSSQEIVITVKTIGSPFELRLSKDSDFSDSRGNIIVDWDGTKGVGYDNFPYSLANKNIKNNPVLTSQSQNINTNGELNIYTYRINIGTLIEKLQAAGNYSFNLSFYLHLNY